MAISHSEPNDIYAWSRYFPDTLFKSTDYGMHFDEFIKININLATDFVTQIVLDPKDPNVIYLATWNGLLRSEDNGKTWNETDLTNKDIQCIAFNKRNPNIMYVGSKRWLICFKRWQGNL